MAFDTSKQDIQAGESNQNSMEKYKFFIDDDGLLRVRTGGSFQLTGLNLKGKIKSVQLNNANWTQLTTGIEKVNAIAIQNKSGNDISIAFEDEALGIKARGELEGISFVSDIFGAIGNSIGLVFDSVSLASSIVNAWNIANPTNTVSFTGDDKIISAQTLNLSGGADKKVYSDQWIVEDGETFEADIRNNDIKIYGTSKVGETPTIKIMEVS